MPTNRSHPILYTRCLPQKSLFFFVNTHIFGALLWKTYFVEDISCSVRGIFHKRAFFFVWKTSICGALSQKTYFVEDTGYSIRSVFYKRVLWLPWWPTKLEIGQNWRFWCKNQSFWSIVGVRLTAAPRNGGRDYATGISLYGVATISRLLKIIGLFCKRAL